MLANNVEICFKFIKLYFGTLFPVPLEICVQILTIQNQENDAEE